MLANLSLFPSAHFYFSEREVLEYDRNGYNMRRAMNFSHQMESEVSLADVHFVLFPARFGAFVGLAVP